MFLAWFPWKFLVGRMARYHGFLDPIAVMARLNRFAQPSEVAAPLELVRAGVVFHARGLVNTKAIQQNLDWIWPYWVRRQFDPHDVSFVPRAFSITHINLTHRNWTAVGVPGHGVYPIVDPAGLVTPLLDGWSIDGWIISGDGEDLYPSDAPHLEQELLLHQAEPGLEVHTTARAPGRELSSRCWVSNGENGLACHIALEARSDRDGFLVASLRPYNPEGISFVHAVESAAPYEWLVDRAVIRFAPAPERSVFSTYTQSDVHLNLRDRNSPRKLRCEVGMATGAALYPLRAGEQTKVEVIVPLTPDEKHEEVTSQHYAMPWQQALLPAARLLVPDERFQFLYDAAVRSLILHAPSDVYPGPYTYKRFWFRDAAFILHAMLCIGLDKPVSNVLRRYPQRQHLSGYFYSQDGEWDSNGEALWILSRYCRLSGTPVPELWRQMITRGAEWISRKRVAADKQLLHAGLLPAGFSAEHLGNNDFYYWDDFWSVAGYQAAAGMVDDLGDQPRADRWRAQAHELLQAMEQSLERSRAARGRIGWPASPYRRLDAGAVGSLVGSYPLQILPERDERLLDTLEFLLQRCSYKNAFFQEMIHSGINAYLTLHLAQVLLRAGDPRWELLWQTVADLASPTGQWPEAIHPRTGGGCMGDGHHVWASAEWVMMTRNAFVREEAGRLILCSGVRRQWLQPGAQLSFGPAPTPWGAIDVAVHARDGEVKISWKADWRKKRSLY